MSERTEAAIAEGCQDAAMRMFDALIWATVWVREAAERAEVLLSDRRNAIALRAWSDGEWRLDRG